MSGHAHAVMRMWRSEVNLGGGSHDCQSILSLHHTGSRHQTQVTRLGASIFIR